MKDETKLLLQLINDNKTLNEMSNILGLSNKQLFIRLSMLRNRGYLLDREYDFDGEIRYLIKNPFQKDELLKDTIHLKTSQDAEKLRMLITSDTHLAHKKDNLKILDAMMNYCRKEGIHIIINAGDFLHGIYSGEKKNTKVLDAFEQIQYGLKNYPYDKNIFTIVCLGNHDATFWINDGLDIKTILMEQRHDIIPLGYGIGVIHFLNNRIILQHPIERLGIVPKVSNQDIVIRGHSHKFKIYETSKGLMVYAPTTSFVETQSMKNPIPSVIDMELTIGNGGIENEYFQQFIFVDNHFVRVSEISYGTKPVLVVSKTNENLALKNNPDLSFDISYLEETKKVISSGEVVEAKIQETSSIEGNLNQEENLISTVETKNSYQRMSQVEKFNTKYGSPVSNSKILVLKK